MLDFFSWCKDTESAKSPHLFGMDCYSLFASKKLLLEFLALHDPEFAREASTKLKYIDSYTNPHDYADAVTHGNLSRIATHIQDTLTSIQSRLQWHSHNYDCTPSERLSAEQNCEVLIAADEYYRKQVTEPAGSQASWNARDQHMTTTILRIRAHLGEDTKIVIWAHNSHVGDSTATSSGGDSFTRNETWNLGQMVRGTFGPEKTWIVGQYTHDGTVTAASNWGGAHSKMTLKPSFPDSYERHMHDLSTTHLSNSSYYFTTSPFLNNTPNLLNALATKHPVPLALAELLSSSRLQRWVGVQYKPETERQSHYGELMLTLCYDQVVFIPTTSALLPPSPKPSSHAGTSGQTLASSKRLLKEYQRLLRKPPPNIQAHPLESNMLEWHFVITPTEPPFLGGEYHGSLEFPIEYPMRPPAFRVFTPSGRFETNTRLCMSMSDFHPESWNPSWSVETLLVGLQSFMLEDSNAIGSTVASFKERERLAALSVAHNQRNAIFREIFNVHRSSDDPSEPPPAEAESVCRFCFSSEGELISPCMCKGSNEWVHLECLREWQKRVLIDQPTHPQYQTSIDSVCNVCLEPFTGIGEAPSRHDQILSYTTPQLAKLASTPGNLLVSTRESSRESLEIIEQHPEIRDRLITWTKAVFLMTDTYEGRRDDGGLVAVSMSMPIDQPPNDVSLDRFERRAWSNKSCKEYSVLHFDGGPMNRDEPVCVAHVPNAKCGAGVRVLTGGWIFGDFDRIAAAVASTAVHHTINVVWGCGGWGGTQILAEIARGGWGLVTVAEYTRIRPDPNLEMSFKLDFSWERIVPLAVTAPNSEYSKGRA